MKLLFKIILISISMQVYAQHGITFSVEELSKPRELLSVQSYEDIYKSLILKDAGFSQWEIEQKGIDFQDSILAKSKAPDSLVNFGYHSFFQGMYHAYAHHRPFVLSPDMVWLLISQGFARHVNANPETLREKFVDFSDKSTLKVLAEKDLLKDSIDWEALFPQFTSLIATYTGEELIHTLTADFSTTTAVEKVASEITIMEATEPYFEFVVLYIVCGIPEITLQGTTEDWQKILTKTKHLKKYDLAWWTDELEPVLEEFVKASQGKVDTVFWRNMFKCHSQKKYGLPDVIDGWIVKFFLYDKYGKRNNLNKLIGGDKLPEEMVKVDLKYIRRYGTHSEETMLELWAGFIGLEQNAETFALTPRISWMIKKKDVNNEGLHKKMVSQNIPGEEGIKIEIEEVPEHLKKFNEIYSLHLRFRNQVSIPEWLKEIRIGRLQIDGKITDEETEKILRWFPDTELKINREEYHQGKNGWVCISGNKIPEEVLKLKEIWILEIWDAEYKGEKPICPETLKGKKIDHLIFVNEPSPENLKKWVTFLPETNIYVRGNRINHARE
ncbi:DUF4419 domain-containing protein [Tannerella forsythia]|uniref:DUF4419 domain-containing protein n=1 Tax=Tannerella forsythia TaxID=28112 RepID=A0A3P1Z1P2_TANFO|nr:DUF4419 domain-containing protein [Tannerella forsythia]